MKKISALLLSLVMMFSVFTACGESSLPPEDVAVTIEGREYSVDEFDRWRNYFVTQLEMSNGAVEDWDAEMSDGITYNQYVTDYTLNTLSYYRAIEVTAEEQDISLTNEDYDNIEAVWQEGVTEYGDEESFIAQLTEAGLTEEMYRYVLEVSYLYSRCFASQFGDYGTNLGDEDVEEYLGDLEYYTAKHILFSITDENNEPLSSGEKAEKKQAAKDVLKKLNDYTGEDVGAYFDELSAEYNDDPGAMANPDGYLFTNGEMVPEFEKAVIELEENEISGIVESDFGYHIILRLPVNYDLVAITYSSYGYNYSIRYSVASEMFETSVQECNDSLEIEKGAGYKY